MDFRLYRSEDVSGVLALLEAALGPGSGFDRSPAFWSWKHEQSPFGPSQIMVAAVGAEVVGVRVLMPWEVHHDQASIRAKRAVDVAMAAQQRGQGLYGKLHRASQEHAAGTQLFIGTPNQNSLPVQLKRGWTLVGRPRLLVRPLSPLRILRRLLRPQARTTDNTPFDPGLSPAAVLLQDPGFSAELCGDALLSGGLRTTRSPAYLRWRYAQAPSPPYHAFSLGEQGAALVRARHRAGLRELILCELLLARPDGAALRRLLAALVDSAPADYVIASATPGTLTWNSMLRCGFLPVPERHGGALTCLVPGGEVQADGLARWRLSLGDLELL